MERDRDVGVWGENLDALAEVLREGGAEGDQDRVA